MAEIHDIKKTRKKRRQKVRNRRLLIILIICGVILLFFSIKSFLDEVPVFSMARTNFSAMQDSTDFPIHIVGDRQYGMFFAKNYLAIKSDIYLFLYDKTGNFISENQVGLEDPSYSIESDKILYYTIGGKNLYTQNIYGSKTTMSTEDSIVTADLSEQGDVAVVVSNKHHIPRVEIYDRGGSKKPFTLYADSNSRIASVTFSKDSKSILVNSFRAEDGQLVSKLSYYNINQEAPKYQVEIKGSLVYSIETHSGNIVVVCDDQIVFFDQEWTKISSYDFEGRILTDFDNKGFNGVVVGLSEYGVNASSVITSLDHKGEQLCSIVEKNSDQQITVSENNIYILSDNTVNWFNMEGTQLGSYEHPLDTIDFLISQNYVFILSTNMIEKIKLVEFEK